MTKLLKALLVAYLAHYGQKDKAGKSYIKHPIYVARKVKGRDAKIVALLHDTVEDTCITDEYIRNIFGDKIADAVKALTHDKSIPYAEYLQTVKKNELARKVKIYDLQHNMQLERLKVITIKDIDRVSKYSAALEELLKCH